MSFTLRNCYASLDNWHHQICIINVCVLQTEQSINVLKIT